MHDHWVQRLLASVAVPALVARAVGVGAAGVAAGPVTAAPVTAAPAAALPATAGPASRMIVLLAAEPAATGSLAARRAVARDAQAPILGLLHAAGARVLGTLSLPDAIVADLTAAQVRRLSADPRVAAVAPDVAVRGPQQPTVAVRRAAAVPATGLPARPTAGPVSRRSATSPPEAPQPGVPTPIQGSCSANPAAPQSNPEALSSIDAQPWQLGGQDGAGVRVAFLADGIDTTNPDFQRNAAFASASSAPGSPVIRDYQDFSGDGTAAATAGGEAFLDASSIAAQGNRVYDLDSVISASHQQPGGCYVTVTGDAPGASVTALKVFAQNDLTTASAFIQAIQYAVSSGDKVINESFGVNNLPDTTLDVIRDANDQAVAAGVTVVASSGDAGVNSTQGSPSTDPRIISAGASTTFRAYAQDSYGGINAPHVTGYVGDNVSALSSGGFAQAGGTVDLVAPGDLNWALCSPASTYQDCSGADLQLSGGTSEASPLTAGAAADVIAAYAGTHGGVDPSPALVKQILMSTATDIRAPADQQGAGLLDVHAAILAAQSVGTTRPGSGVLLAPGQIHVSQDPGRQTLRSIRLTNASGTTQTVTLSTRAFTRRVGTTGGQFCMQPDPAAATTACPANTGVLRIWSGVAEVYQDVRFTVPATSGVSRLVFDSDYRYTGQQSLMHVALVEPDGTYAGYSLPQGLADFSDVEVADPPAGRWTAVFFTEKDGATSSGGAPALGTSGPVQWSALTEQARPADRVTPSVLRLRPGASAVAEVQVTSPAASGDTAESVVVDDGAATTTVPVTVRTRVPTTRTGGTFSGVLTGGNGRAGAPAQTSTYAFDVPAGTRLVHADISLANDHNDLAIAELIDPHGNDVGYSSNVTADASGTPRAIRSLDLYHVRPEAGRWKLALFWLNPVSGNELSEPFAGRISFDDRPVTAQLPHGGTLAAGRAVTIPVTVHNPGRAPMAVFTDGRLDRDVHLGLVNQSGGVDAASTTLPLTPSEGFPYYLVPTGTSSLTASVRASVPVTFDMEYFPGDPDVSPLVPAPGVTGSERGDGAALTLTRPDLSPGLWLVDPEERGAAGAAGYPAATSSESLTAVTRAFDRAVRSPTGDLWSLANGQSTAGFSPQYIPAFQTRTIDVRITPAGPAGSLVAGVLYVDALTLGAYSGLANPDADVIAALPYHYTVGPARA